MSGTQTMKNNFEEFNYTNLGYGRDLARNDQTLSPKSTNPFSEGGLPPIHTEPIVQSGFDIFPGVLDTYHMSAPIKTQLDRAKNALIQDENAIANAQGQLQALRANGITMYSGADPDSGARVLFNSLGIVGYNASNTPTFTLNSSNGNVAILGSLTAGSTISGSQITGSELRVGSGNNVFEISESDSFYAAWAGNANPALAPFWISKAGAIKALSGQMGPWSITSTSIQTGPYNTSGNYYFGNSGLSISTAFRVNSAGGATMTGANVTGVLNATGGTFTGTVSVNGTLQSSSSGTRWVLENSPGLRFYDATRERMRLDNSSLRFWNSSGASTGTLQGINLGGFGAITQLSGGLDVTSSIFAGGISSTNPNGNTLNSGGGVSSVALYTDGAIHMGGGQKISQSGSSTTIFNLTPWANGNPNAVRVDIDSTFSIWSGIDAFRIDGNGNAVLAGNVISDQFTPSQNNLYRLGVVGGGWSEVNAYSYVTLSDRRLKKDFVPFKKRIGMTALEMVQAIPVTTYKYNDAKGEHAENIFVGWIAQDVEKVAPDLVHVPQEDNKKRFERLSRREGSLNHPLTDHEKQELDGLKANMKSINDRDMLATLWEAFQNYIQSTDARLERIEKALNKA